MRFFPELALNWCWIGSNDCWLPTRSDCVQTWVENVYVVAHCRAVANVKVCLDAVAANGACDYTILVDIIQSVYANIFAAFDVAQANCSVGMYCFRLNITQHFINFYWRTMLVFRPWLRTGLAACLLHSAHYTVHTMSNIACVLLTKGASRRYWLAPVLIAARALKRIKNSIYSNLLVTPPALKALDVTSIILLILMQCYFMNQPILAFNNN